MVRAAMMYATARYYTSEYDKMLRDNADEIEPVYRASNAERPARN
jgi:hypothetical protein